MKDLGLNIFGDNLLEILERPYFVMHYVLQVKLLVKLRILYSCFVAYFENIDITQDIWDI